MGFFRQLENRAREIDSLLCVGLDPHLDQLASHDSQAAFNYCVNLIDSTLDIALAYKLNSAFFEYFGSHGVAVLEKLIDFIPDDIPIILDGKRCDIASSATAYARAMFGKLKVDAATINPYMGHDSIIPFLQNEDKGVFLLCKTSNPGANDFQNLRIGDSACQSEYPSGQSLYLRIAAMAVKWNVKDNLGLVVGATQVESLNLVRRIAPELWILAPGIGAQGGDLDRALRAGLREDGFGMAIPVSRGISEAPDARKAAMTLNSEINRTRDIFIRNLSRINILHTPDPAKSRLATDILEFGCVKFGDFTLKSGINSPIYIDLRRLPGNPALLSRVGDAYIEILNELKFDHIAGIPYAGLPIATAVSLAGNLSLIYPRKEPKVYGTKEDVEGVYSSGQQVVMIDDLTTTGGTKFEALEKLQSAGLSVKDIVVFIDRESGAVQALSKSGYQLHAVFTLSQLLEIWASAGQITLQQVEKVKKFLQEIQSKY